jgi:hypothetical protein
MVFTTDTISGQHVIVGGSNDHRFAGVRLVPHPIHEAWKHRLGQYKRLNPPEVYKFWQIGNPELKIEGDYLVSATPGPEGDSTLVLRTVNAREVIIEGYGRGLGETLRIIRDEEGEEILIHSGLRYKRIRSWMFWSLAWPTAPLDRNTYGLISITSQISRAAFCGAILKILTLLIIGSLTKLRRWPLVHLRGRYGLHCEPG